MDKKQVSFRIEPDIVKRLKFVALEQDRSLTDLILEAIKEILKKYEKKDKNSA
jgi:predicted transcriptional regulator